MDGQIVLSLGGKERVVKFNHSAIFELGIILKVDPAQINVKLAELAKQNAFRVLTFIVYAGIVGYHEEECNYTHGITLKDVAKWMNNANLDEFETVWKLFKDSTDISDVLKNVNKGNKKKAEAEKK